MPTTRPASRRSPKITPVGGTTSRARGPVAAQHPPAQRGVTPVAPQSTPASKGRGKSGAAPLAPPKPARVKPALATGRASRPSAGGTKAAKAGAKAPPKAAVPKRSAVLAAVVPTPPRSPRPAVLLKATISGAKRSRIAQAAVSRASPARAVPGQRVAVERAPTTRAAVGRARGAPTRGAPTKGAPAKSAAGRGKGTARGGAAPAMRLVRVKALDPCTRCGPNTSVEQLYRVDEQVAGTATVHLVFFDRHGWYCVHGASCAAVRDVHAELKAQRAGAGRGRS